MLGEDDEELRASMVSVLAEYGYEVHAVPDGRALMDSVTRLIRVGTPPALAIADQRMPKMSGLAVADAIRRRNLGVPLVLVTAFGDEEIAEEARHAGVPMLRKPFDIEDLMTVVEYVIDRKREALLECAGCGAVDDLRAADDGPNVFYCVECRRQLDEFDANDPRFDLGGRG
jgi:DNA-binding response OmpR family regulator